MRPLLALLLATSALAAPDDGDAPAYPLDRAAYRFCHEPGHQASEARAWCDLLDDVPPERCPGLRRTCAEAGPPAPAGCAPEEYQGGDPIGAPPGAREPGTGPGGCPMPSILPPATGGGALLRWVGALAVAAVVAVILRLLVVWFGRPQPVRRAAPAVRRVEEEPLDDVPDLPSAELLARARAAIEEGDAALAAQLGRSAALRRLAELRRIALHRSRTDREYVRAVRASDRAVGDVLADIVAAVEAHRFGGRALDLDRARAVVRAAERIVTAALVLACLLPTEALAQNRHGPSGDAALRELFEQYGYAPRWLEGRITGITDPPDVLVLDPTRVSVDGEEWEWIAAFVHGGGLLLLGGDASQGFPALGGRAMLDAPAPTEADPSFPDDLPAPAWPGGVDHVWVGIDGEPWVNAVGTGEGDGVPSLRHLDAGERVPTVVLLRHGEGAVLAFADERLLRNGALVHPDNERFLAEVPRRLHDDPVDVLLATSSTSGSPPPSRGAVANPRLIPFVLQLGLTWTLLVLWRGWPFGVRRDATDAGRARFVEHVSALAARWAQLGATGWALRASARLWWHRLGPEGLELAARRAGYEPARARRFVETIGAAAQGDGRTDDPSDLDKVEELWRITTR